MSPAHAPHQRYPRAGSLAILAVLALLAAIAAPASARAASAPAPGPFGLMPAPAPDGQPRPYFNLTIPPGRSAWDTAIISNEGTRAERLKVTISRGVTAANSGSAYESITGKCAGAGCWITGLPTTITLAPGARKTLAFQVTVPARTRPAQYLAGITAQSAIRPRAVRVSQNGHTAARAVIIDQVTAGIAVTVGPLSQMRTALLISAVSAGWIGPTPRLYIPVHNPGQKFDRATGTISCTQNSRRHSYRVIMETVLPGGSAVLPVNTPGLNTGPAQCTVRLHNRAGTTFTWSGIVNVPSRTRTTIVHTANGAYTSLPQHTVPPWAIALIVLGALILAAVLAQFVLRRRQRPAHAARNRSLP